MQFQNAHNPNCTFCGLPILRGAEVFYNKGTYHPGCAATVAKEKKNETAHTRRDEDNESGACEPANALVH